MLRLRSECSYPLCYDLNCMVMVEGTHFVYKRIDKLERVVLLRDPAASLERRTAWTPSTPIITSPRQATELQQNYQHQTLQTRPHIGQSKTWWSSQPLALAGRWNHPAIFPLRGKHRLIVPEWSNLPTVISTNFYFFNTKLYFNYGIISWICGISKIYPFRLPSRWNLNFIYPEDENTVFSSDR